MPQQPTARSFFQSSVYLKGRWLSCALPPLAFIALEETPGLSGLNGINAAALIVLSPVAVGVGFGLTAGIVKLTRWIGGKVRMRSRAGLAGLMLTIVGILSPHAYLDGDWLLLGVIEIASLPAALLLATVQTPKREDS
ncbi:hypothetical protein [Asticcacaulis sp. 201]|uniref:hypothetical protein n=1 Tax=Asticcacaulis sp. 201 TaxID=3028787 RepID=UPI0029162B95|nr:hypothetical protein [Asticcacaulis sp. 201]MDV6329981.1 hypothetical protein [Asticcacaulis sp. 201]